MDKNTLTETNTLQEKIARLEESNRQLLSINEFQKNEIEILNATITHYEDSAFHKMRDVYTRFKYQFKRQVTDKNSSGFRFFIFIKLVFGLLLTIAKILFRKIYFKITRKELGAGSNDDYKKWRELNMPKASDFQSFVKHSQSFQYQPVISIILPTYNPPIKYFEMAIQSVIDQLYPHWELCISDDNSNDPLVKATIEKYRLTDDRIKVIYRSENGHISVNSNTALSLANGEFIALLDHDDLLTKDALYHAVNALNNDRSIDFIYSDEDKVDDKGHFSQPHFKPAYCPDNLLTRNYITHLAIIRLEIVRKISGFREGFEGSQDYDLFHRVVEQTNNIYHLPKILYHWRIHPGSTSHGNDAKPYAAIAGINSIKQALERRGESAIVQSIRAIPSFYSIKYHLKKEEKVSIIIPTKNKADVLKTCIDSIFRKSTYRNFEIILLDNNSDESSLFDLVENYKKLHPGQFKCIPCNYAFNYSKLMNDGVKHATGEYILLLNNDTEVITSEWLELMLGHAQRKSTGCVGVKLLFYNNSIQHGGVIMGLGGIAGHSFFKRPKSDDGYFAYLRVASNYSAVTAACLMVKKNIYLEVDGFDESIAIEFNDVDFCLKVREKGYNNIFVPDVELYHYESLSRGTPLLNSETMKVHIREVNIIESRWKKYIDNDPCYSPNLSLTSDFKIRLHQ